MILEALLCTAAVLACSAVLFGAFFVVAFICEKYYFGEWVDYDEDLDD